MTNNYSPNDVLSGLIPAGCVQPYIRDFTDGLVEAGYSILPARDYARAAGHLGRWLDVCNIELENLQAHHLESFAHHLCGCPGTTRPGRAPSRRYIKRVRRFVEHLRQLGIVAAVESGVESHSSEHLIGFREWMLRHRGVRERTIDGYERLLLKVVHELGDPADYDAALVRRVVLDRIRGLGPAYAKKLVTALRAFLRYLATDGRCRAHLDQAVPNIPHWTLSSLPRHIEAETVERVIESCDLDKAHGVRDRAILLLLARLGLRAGDIVGMLLNDIDWTSATLNVRGKGRRETALPLPQDAGDALLRYLTDVRPDVDTDRVFLCANAPIRPLGSSTTVSCIVMLALRRAGITDAPSQGAHLLRHSAAVSMLRSGVGVDTISTVLRHRSADMTAYYAKVDVALLESIAQPWIVGAPC